MKDLLGSMSLLDPATSPDLQSTIEKPELPVLITTRFEALDNGSIALQVSGTNEPSVFLSVIHEGREAGPAQTMQGDQTAKPIFVRDAESVMILARYEGAIIANALLEIRPVLIESIDRVANPVATFNMLVDQVNMARTERRLVRLERRRDADPDETVLVSAVKVGGVQ